MRIVARDSLIVLVPENKTETATVAALSDRNGSCVFRLTSNGQSAVLKSLGPEPVACNHPINIWSKSPVPLNAISNFAPTPFHLDGHAYASVEGFWQSLRWSEPDDRRRIGALWGSTAKFEGSQRPWPEYIEYGDEQIRWGTVDHWRLMRRACMAKFEQNENARQALLATGSRPLTHCMRRDSASIPGVIMASIWMAVRRHLSGEDDQPCP